MSSNLPGAIPTSDGTLFSVWALGRRTMSVIIADVGEFDLKPEEDGYFSVELPDIGAGARYKFRIEGSADAFPDPASRWQPEGAQGWSVVVAADGFSWTDGAWAGVSGTDAVMYELHIGTFTPQGTWAGAMEKLETLCDLGVTVLQLMPIGTFEGRFGWGYDTVLPYAPTALYGTPDELRAFIDKAHSLGIGVILDVVYNHVGTGDHFKDFSAHYFTDRHHTEWGATFDFDSATSRGVRDFIVGNAVYWVRDFHFDGLRLDATQALFDDSEEHVIAELARMVRAAAGARSVYLVAENQPQDRQLVTAPDEGGYGLDALGNDDFHHSARVALTGHTDFYYRDYVGTAQELLSSAKYGFLYHGQRSDMRDGAYGTDNLDTHPRHIVNFLENHDQIANSARGFRLATLGSPARVRAVTGLWLLCPQTPMFFQGQEFGASNPFFYFAGVDGEVAEAVAGGRRESLLNFPSVQDPQMTARLPEPSDPTIFAASTLDWSEWERHAHIVALHRDLLTLRRDSTAFRQSTKRRVDGAVLADGVFALRYVTEDKAEQRLVIVNLGRDLNAGVIAEPLIAPPGGRNWQVEWSSEDPIYGGIGRRPLDLRAYSVLPANATIVLSSRPAEKKKHD